MTTLRLRQLQVVHRHGDRTPLRNVFQGASARAEQEEHVRWHQPLPQPEQFASVRVRFPVEKAAGVHDPRQTRPFGYLTTTGIAQMRARGDKLRALCARESFSLDTLASTDVQVYSNSYTRTQLSAQALLSGLLRDTPDIAPRIQVLAPDNDIINTYALFPEIAQLKAALEHTNDELAAHERAMAPRKRELQQLLPLFHNAPFTWMAAADYYVCRTAHDIPLIAGTEAHHHATIDHLSLRFHHFYSNARILTLVAGRLLQHMLIEMEHTVTHAARATPLVVYSGHDISVLSLLHAIDAPPPMAQRHVDGTGAYWWPDYAAAVTLELLQDVATYEWFVRATLDDAPLRLQADDDVSRNSVENDGTLVPWRAFHALVTAKLERGSSSTNAQDMRAGRQ